MPNILAVIPARGGSKGIRKKNLIDLVGKQLIAHTLCAVRDSKYVFDHVVSTDSNRIAKIAREYEGCVPYMRPKYLARDSSNVIDVVQYVLKRAPKEYEYIMLLQPTCPLRSYRDIDACIRLAVSRDANSVCSFTSITSAHPRYIYYLSDQGVKPVVSTKAGRRRQTFRPVVLRNGAIYIVKTKYFKRYKSFVRAGCIPYMMPPDRSVNIDDRNDLKLARYYFDMNTKSHSPS